jgi:tRNA-dihydrouridine synthase
MIATGCEVMGDGAFSIKVRLGVEKGDEFLSLVSIVNSYPLRFLTVHARTAKQMYEGECDIGAFRAIADAVKVPLVYNGDAFLESGGIRGPRGAEDLSKFNLHDVMIGRGFVRYLASRDDIGELIGRYIDSSVKELGSPRPVLGRMKELLAYWKDFPRWSGVWKSAKMAKTLDELKMCLA